MASVHLDDCTVSSYDVRLLEQRMDLMERRLRSEMLAAIAAEKLAQATAASDRLFRRVNLVTAFVMGVVVTLLVVPVPS
jgi:hypothetical protein